jgi:hypothetical protein
MEKKKSPKSRTITKSKYINGVQCPAYLWLEMNEPERIPPMNSAVIHRMEQGKIFGELATKLFPEGVKIETEDFMKNIERTKELVELKERIELFEAGFLFERKDGKIYARIDILKPASENSWDIIEVKSGTRVKDINLADIVFQKYVCEKAGLKINSCIIAHANNEYVFNNKLNIEKLVVLENVDNLIEEMYESVEGNLKRFFEIIQLPECPKVTKEDILTAEYNNVAIDEFYDSLPEENVFQLYRIFKKNALELYEKGIIQIKDIPENFKLNDKQKIQKKCCDEKCNHIDKKEIKSFLNNLKYPLYYLDFETFNEVIPRYNGTKPYQQIPFQFSLHIIEKKGDKPKHISFLAEGNKDPRKDFVKALKENLGNKGSIVVYNESFEKRILRECCEMFSENKEWCNKLFERFVDLLEIFRGFSYYSPKQKGSASIKDVLPIFSKDVKYSDLVIKNGEDASLSYLKSCVLGEASSEEREKIREALERYCELDTYAEVILVDELEKAC